MSDGGEQARPRGLAGATARLGASLLGLARSRLELASVEFAEERDRLQQQFAMLLGAAAMFAFAVLFAAVWVVVYFWDTNRLTAIAIVAAVFAGAGALLLMVRKEYADSAPTPFAATIAELDRDRVALSGGAPRDPPAPPPP